MFDNPNEKTHQNFNMVLLFCIYTNLNGILLQNCAFSYFELAMILLHCIRYTLSVKVIETLNQLFPYFCASQNVC